MSRNIPWLDKYAEQLKKQEAEKKMTKTASSNKKNKTITASEIKLAKKVILKKESLPKAVNGNTVKYNGFMWKVVNASYKDAKGAGVLLQKIAEISKKKVTDPEERAYTDPGDVYDYEVRDSYEVPEMQETATATETRISQENALDRTTPAGRATNPYVSKEENIFEDIVEENFDEKEEEKVEEPSTEDVPAEHDMESSEEISDEDENETAEEKEEEKEEVQKTSSKRANPILASIIGKTKKRKNPILANICK